MYLGTMKQKKYGKNGVPENINIMNILEVIRVMIRVSELINIKDINKEKVNMVVSGTGSGKSYWAIKVLPDELNVKPEDVLFVTSRTITKEQQIESYEETTYLDNTDLGNYYEAINPKEWLFETKEFREYRESIINHDRKVHILTYNQFESILKNDIINHIKVVVFDEYHAMYSDNYNASMKVVRDSISKLISKGIIVIGMTATIDDIPSREKRRFNYLLDKPLYVYHVTNKFSIVKSKTHVPNIVNNLEGNTLYMAFSAKEAIEIANKYPNAKAIVSRNNELRTKEMDELQEYIVKNKKLPEGTNILVGTSCIREGFEFQENEEIKANIKNVIIHSYDPVCIKQFIGRYRHDIENLYVVYDSYYDTKVIKDSMTRVQSKHFEEFKNLIYGKSAKWLHHFDEIVNRDVIKYEMSNNDKIKDKFIEYIRNNWTNELIYTKEQKDEIISYAHDLGIRKTNKHKVTFNYLVSLIEESGIEVDKSRKYIDGKRYRVIKFL